MVVAAPQKNIQTGASAKKSSGKNWLLRLAPYLVWQVIALLVVELVLFTAGIGEEEIFKLDPILGTKHMSNKRVTWRSEGYAQSYFDQDGMRESGLTVAKPAGTYRIALLGDSIVEGLQVPLKETFGQIVQRRLQADLKMPVQVLNFGTSGYSTCQEFLQLKMQVMKYKPDLVLLCFNSRDMFENWSPPDETITNVRPIALHLPGGHLIIDSMPVVVWMHTSRARFLLRIDWLRHNSRIWGLISAQQTEWSFNSPIYRALTKLIHQPGVAIRELVVALLPKASTAPSFNTTTATATTTNAAGNSAHAATAVGSKGSSEALGRAVPAAQEPVKEELNSATPNRVLAKSIPPLAPATTATGIKPAGQKPAASVAAPAVTAKPADGKKTYIDLIARTESSLFAEALKICKQGDAKFAVVIMPVRSALCPIKNMETEFLGIDYPTEIKLIDRVCHDRSIPLVDAEKPATMLSPDEASTLFYSVHLTPKGQQYVADSIYPFVNNLVSAKVSGPVTDHELKNSSNDRK